jgi:pimeloyl-ACP methyl ester carboxylesterase
MGCSNGTKTTTQATAKLRDSKRLVPTMITRASTVPLPYLTSEQSRFSVCEHVSGFSVRVLLADDAVPLRVYEAGDESCPCVVLVNPLGISCVFLLPLGALLADEFHVITWESRGLPNYIPRESGAQVNYSLARQCRDLAWILRERASSCAGVVAYCSGASLAVYGLSRRIFEARKACFVSPSLNLGSDVRKTDYQRYVLPLWPQVLRNPTTMLPVVRTLFGRTNHQFACQLDRELATINALPFTSDETIYRYAELLVPALEADYVKDLQNIIVPALIVSSGDDDIVSDESTQRMAVGLRESSWHKIARDGHFAIYKSRAMQQEIKTFLAN